MVLSAIGRFFARIGRWIKETAWIQPLLIVGAIFAVIFSIPYVIDGVESLFDESDAADKYFAKYQLSLKNADVIPDGKSCGTSKVDELFTYLEEDDETTIVDEYGERFFLVFVEKNSNDCKDLYGGLKVLQEKWSSKNAEFASLKGKFQLYTIYTDAISEVDDETVLFDEAWSNHYSLFESISSNKLENTFYAKNRQAPYGADTYTKAFVGDQNTKTSPIIDSLLMYFDFTEDNLIENQVVVGLSDVIFSCEGTSDLDKARTLRDCWSHSDIFGELKNN